NINQGIVSTQRTLGEDSRNGFHLRTRRHRSHLSTLAKQRCSQQASRNRSCLWRSNCVCHLHGYFEKICCIKQGRQSRFGTFLPSNPRMDLSVRLAIPNSPLTTGGSLDLQLEPAIMAWNPIPRPPLNRSRLLLLCRRRVQDRSRKSSNLRQPGPSVRRHNLSPPTPRESQPMARSKLPTDSDRRGPRQQTAQETAVYGSAIMVTLVNHPCQLA